MSLRDWSSDVCSSDLADLVKVPSLVKVPPPLLFIARSSRSEERRVGKECRTRWPPKLMVKADQVAFLALCRVRFRVLALPDRARSPLALVTPLPCIVP